MAEPKKRTNNTKQGMRRMHDRVVAPALVYCEHCHERKVKHVVCQNCGYYEGKEVISKVTK